ncbi:MAG: ABC transporter substrate-binding protein [Acidimicrobiia bacterium]|nr:ABC transporter substrate-binding protein [Acidimicrobiia bacterium]
MSLAQSRPISRRLLLLGVVLFMLSAACGDGDSATTTEPAAAGGAATTAAVAEACDLTVLFPVNSPILHGFRVADEAGYLADEGVNAAYEFFGGGGEAITQLIAGNGDAAIVPVGNVVEAIEEGNTDLRSLWNYTYGSIFYIATPTDSGIATAEDLDGKKVGISDLAGGEVPIVRGIIASAGLTEADVELIPVGEGTALAVNAVETGQVDAVGGSINDIIALEVQGLELNYIIPGPLLELPAVGFVMKEEVLNEKSDCVQGFLRAVTKGYYWAQVNPENTLALLKKVTPEQFTDDTGARIFDAVITLTWVKDWPNVPMGFQSGDTWGAFFDFIGAERPDVPLGDIVIDDYIPGANDWDPADVKADADAYTP